MTENKPQVSHTQTTYGLRPEATDFPMMVVLSYVYICNAKCPNCPYNNSEIRDDYDDAVIMPDEIFRRIADECGPHGSLIRLSGGGEPMLHPKAVEHIVYAKEKGARIGLITNGSRFNQENLKTLIGAGIDAIELSVDAGDPETYQRVRPGLSWETLNRNARWAVEFRNELKSKTRVVCSIINQESVDVEKAEAYWSALVDKVQVRKYLTWGYNQDHSADSSPYLPPENRIPCPWLFERLNIDSKGYVTLCGEDIAFEHKFVNIMDRSIRDIWLGEEFKHFRERHLAGHGDDIPICATCPDWQYRSWQYNYWKVLKDADTKKSGE